MQIIGCDLHASQQSVAVLDQDTGETFETTLKHEGDTVRDFYAALQRPVIVGIEATGSMGWFLTLMEDLAITCRVGHPARIRATEPRRQKHDRRDAVLLRDLLAADRFPAIWQPSTEFRDLRALLLHRDEWVRMRTRVRKPRSCPRHSPTRRTVEPRRPGHTHCAALAAACIRPTGSVTCVTRRTHATDPRVG